MNHNIVQIALPLHQNKSVFDYYSDNKCDVGNFVKISFRGKDQLGVVWSKEASTIDKSKLKNVQEVITGFSLTKAQVKFLQFLSYYNMASIGAVLKLIMPSTKKLKTIEGICDHYKIDLPKLNKAQESAFDTIADKLDNYNVTLLDGVTGSGKTEVYCYAIAKILANTTDQVLVLMPEIMLSNQFVSRFEQRFGIKPHIWHSSVSQKDKKELWHLTAQGNARLIIGTRSALFLPFKHLKLIVLDEEHDLSYKQEDGIVYNARDMAVAYSHYNNSPIILCSATPSIETLHNVTLNKYSRCSLAARYGDNLMPDISVVDMRKVRLKKNQWISPLLQSKVSDTLKQGHQVMLFLNRKGYAPITLCKSCGYKEQCHNCEAFLVTHKAKNKLICHHCGYNKEVSNVCSSCDAEDSLINCGPGVERIEEEVQQLWPDARSFVVTRDTVDQNETNEILQKILNKEVDIIIGTQILSKGYHFPALNLVGVIDADIGLIGVDLRASERTYQLLHQVSGRAGRESKGEAVIQTYYPDNEILRSLQHNNSKNFYHSEIKARESVNMPPFKRLVAVILSGTNPDKLQQIVTDIAKAIPYTKEITVLGPAPAPISLLRGRYRYRFLIRSNTNIKIQSFVRSWLASIKLPKSIRLKLDVDPYNFL
jgi:primosomal protein N' (replication factor Y) (superfamily II helicase)